MVGRSGGRAIGCSGSEAVGQGDGPAVGGRVAGSFGWQRFAGRWGNWAADRNEKRKKWILAFIIFEVVAQAI